MFVPVASQYAFINCAHWEAEKLWELESWSFLHLNIPHTVAMILFLSLYIFFLPIQGYELCFFTEISQETLFLTLMKVYGRHTAGLRSCEYTLPKYEYKKLTAL